ncbi:MAG: hypothetical protein HY825_16885 [Acidobacteria bacterium]|nr:hypothetical protein [Acidobacteriota bacterium]
MRLATLRRGQMRAIRLRLMEVAGSAKRPTEFYLDVKVCCDVPEQTYYLDVKADFGARPPRSARLVVLKNRYDATTPVGLIEGSACVERGVPLEIRADTEKIVFWITAEGSAAVPPKLAAEIRVRPPPPPPAEPPEELDTMRLPSIKSVITDSLARALITAPTGPMTVLGEILAAPATTTAARDVSRLIDAGADMQLVEAAVRAIETAEQAGKASPPIDFPTLCLNEPAGAAIAVFHPQTPPYLLNQTFIIALENHLGIAAADPIAAYWKQLAKSAAIILYRTDRSLLDEDAEVMACSTDPFRTRVLKMMIDWAARKQRPPTAPPAEPLDASLARIADADQQVALHALYDTLLTFGFVGVSAQLD